MWASNSVVTQIVLTFRFQCGEIELAFYVIFVVENKV
jgi:hypothetical protein